MTESGAGAQPWPHQPCPGGQGPKNRGGHWNAGLDLENVHFSEEGKDRCCRETTIVIYFPGCQEVSGYDLSALDTVF